MEVDLVGGSYLGRKGRNSNQDNLGLGTPFDLKVFGIGSWRDRPPFQNSSMMWKFWKGKLCELRLRGVRKACRW
jgi:hypothetical protein